LQTNAFGIEVEAEEPDDAGDAFDQADDVEDVAEGWHFIEVPTAFYFVCLHRSGSF
jgi:hypothetical protein